MAQKQLFCFGFGTVASELAKQLRASGDDWHIIATSRHPESADDKALNTEDVTFLKWDNEQGLSKEDIATFSHSDAVLISVPPDADGCPIARYMRLLGLDFNLGWIGYLSATSVYGNYDGQWVTEQSPLRATSARGKARIKAEEQWMGLYRSQNWPVNIFRLSGIYGPRQNAFSKLLNGHKQAIVKPGHVMGRIHVADIAQSIRASMARPFIGEIYNISDDLPAASHEVTHFAAHLLGLTDIVDIAFEDADLSPMGRSFYEDNRRIDNKKMKTQLGVTLQYPTYREGLTALKPKNH